MRTLAHDLGAALECGAHLSALIRLRTGALWIEDSVTPQQFEEAVERDEWEDLLEPPDSALLGLESIAVEPSAERHLRNGQPVAMGGLNVGVAHAQLRRAYAIDGRFLGVVRFNRAQNHWQPEKLFNLPLASRHAP